MDELKALENIRKLLNLDSDTIPVFDLANKKNYKDNKNPKDNDTQKTNGNARSKGNQKNNENELFSNYI